MPDATPLMTVGRGRRVVVAPDPAYNPQVDLDRAQRAYEKAEKAWLDAAGARRAAALRARNEAEWTWGRIAARLKVNQHRAREIAHPRGHKP